MDYTNGLKNLFAAITMLTLGVICFIRIGYVNLHSIISSGILMVPAIIVMGYLGQKIGEIIDHPKNRADADYKIAVLNALKKMDKSMTMQELNEKLTKTVAEPDAPDTDMEEDLDV